MTATWRIVEGDCRTVMAGMPDVSVDALVCDPPAGISFMGRGWDGDRGGMEQWTAWLAGVMAEALRVVKPGGHALVWALPRTSHWTGMALERAGWEVRDCLTHLFGCLTPDVEVLTPEGWKRGIDVESGERIAQWNPDTEEITLAPVLRTYRAPYSGPMRVLRNHDTDQLLTPNHRVVCENERQQGRWPAVRRFWRNEWTVREARHVWRSGRVRLPLAGYAHGPGVGGEDYAALLGWVWTEGGFDHTGTGVRVYQSPSANPEKVDALDALMGRVAPAHRRYERERWYESRRAKVGTVPVSEVTWFFSGEVARRVRADLPGKRPSFGVLWRMTLGERRAFLDAALAGDGSKCQRTGSQEFYARHRADLETFQVALALTGQRGRLTMRKNRESGQVSVTPRPTTELQTAKLRRADEHYDGEVWCVGVSSGAFVARRGDQVFITGNSGFPKSLDVSKAIDSAAPRAGMFGGFASHFRERREESGLTQKAIAVHFPSRTGGLTGCVWNWENGATVPTLAQWETLAPILGLSSEWLPLIERAEAERTVLAMRTVPDGHAFAGPTYGGDSSTREFADTAPATPEAEQWQGWGTALKPAAEFWFLARRPFATTVAANVLAFGTGAINVDACRVDASDAPDEAMIAPNAGPRYGGVFNGGVTSDSEARKTSTTSAGRWPPNTVFSHSPGCRRVGTRKVKASAPASGPTLAATESVAHGEYNGERDVVPSYAAADGMEAVEAWECSDDCAVRALDLQTGETTSRFFPTFDCGHERAEAERFKYCAKSSSAERNAGLDGFEAKAPAFGAERGDGLGRGISDTRQDWPRANVHPTCKPVSLMRWLVKLVTPPGGTCLDPFLGSGTTGVACVLEGFDFIGVERQGPEYVQDHPGEDDYVAIARARIAWWERHPGVTLVERLDAERGRRAVADSGQLGLGLA